MAPSGADSLVADGAIAGAAMAEGPVAGADFARQPRATRDEAGETGLDRLCAPGPSATVSLGGPAIEGVGRPPDAPRTLPRPETHPAATPRQQTAPLPGAGPAWDAQVGSPPGATDALIGPNAILQMVPVLDARVGPDLRRALLAEAGCPALPDGTGLIPEGPAAALHRAVRRRRPREAPEIAREAGLATADYILAHRIPRLAQGLLRLLPARLAAPLLSGAIARHAWTFAGSGRFSVAATAAPVFLLEDNPVVRGERSDHPLCAWHAAVFERLFQSLVSPRAWVTETACCAQGAPACRFEIRWH